MKTAICAMIKDEQDYLDEWLNYHLNLGINEIYLFEDYNSISHLPITDKYGEKVKLFSIDEIFTNEKYSCSRFEPEGVVNQIKLFDWFPIVYKEELDWVLFIDIDEFLILKYDLNKLLEEYSDKTAILLNWKWYGASGHINKPDGGVMENYIIESPNPFDYWWSHKSFLNIKNFSGWSKHVHEIKNAVFPLTDWGSHKAYLNHYFTKSWEEWKTKLFSRGDVCPGHRKLEHFFLFNPDMLPLKKQLMSDVTERYKGEKK
jgi:hypothetical protein